MAKGNPYGPGPWTDAQYLERIASRCVKDANGCLLWQGWKNWKGYGEMSYRNENVFVHRLIYMLKIGPIPPGMQVCHKCDVRHCCNHEHLWLGTNADNHRDKDAKGRNYFTNQTHCKRGHPFTPENTYMKPPYGTRGPSRCCLTCEAERQKSPEYVAWRREYQRKRRALKRLERVNGEHP